MQDLITPEMVEHLRKLGLNWKYDSCNPSNECDRINVNNNKLWLTYDNNWYCYYSVDLRKLLNEFSSCNTKESVKIVVNRLISEYKLEK